MYGQEQQYKVIKSNHVHKGQSLQYFARRGGAPRVDHFWNTTAGDPGCGGGRCQHHPNDSPIPALGSIGM